MLTELKQEFTRPLAQYVPIVAAGLINGVLAFVKSVLLAALVFSGDLTPFLPEGIGIALYTTLVIALICALTSSIRGTAALIQEAPVGVLALAALHIGQDANLTPNEAFITVVIVLTLTSLLTGLAFLALWRFELGNLVRFIPYPVTGGFLAATGLILIQGSITIMTDQPFAFINPGSALEGDVILRWLPGAVFAAVLLITMRYSTHYLVVPGLLAAALIVFLLGVQVVGSSMQEAQDKGWLLGPFPEGKGWQPFFLLDLGRVNWTTVGGESGHVATAVTISVIGMLLNITGIEMATRRDIDINVELRSAGLANLTSAAGGGMAGFPGMSATLLGHRMGASSRLTGVVMGVLFAAVMLAGPSLVAQFPKVVLGGLLMYLGASIVAEWVYDGWFKMQRGDYAIIIIILVAVLVIGYLEGIVIGIVAAVMLFVVDYSRLTVIKSSYSGAHFHSKADRPTHHMRQLQEVGEKLFILQLEGYLFFGTAIALLNRIMERLQDLASQPMRYLVLDFSRIRRLDSSAIQSFSKIRQTAEAQDFTLIFAGITPQIRAIMQKNGFDFTEGESFRHMQDSDQAIEWCEARILREASATTVFQGMSLREHIESIFPVMLSFDDLAQYLERVEVSEGDYLAHQGQPADALFFVESGKIRVQLEASDGAAMRLRTVHAGALLGEVSIYSDKPRSASLVADDDGVLFRLSVESLRRMEADDQALATVFHKFIAHALAERLTDVTKALEAALL